jgi:hypothetical protein
VEVEVDDVELLVDVDEVDVEVDVDEVEVEEVEVEEVEVEEVEVDEVEVLVLDVVEVELVPITMVVVVTATLRRAVNAFGRVFRARRTPRISAQAEPTVIFATSRTRCCAPQALHEATILVNFLVPTIFRRVS